MSADSGKLFLDAFSREIYIKLYIMLHGPLINYEILHEKHLSGFQIVTYVSKINSESSP